MIIKGKSRAGAASLAKHLGDAEKNERVRIGEVRGTLAGDMRGAFEEMEDVAQATRCEKALYHAKISPAPDEEMTPERWQRAIQVLEENLGLSENHPRVVVFHEKKGREHAHVVWGRIDPETMLAWHDGNNYLKHERTSRQLEREFEHERVKGAFDRAQGELRPDRTVPEWEMQQGDRLKLDPRQVRDEVRALHGRSDSGRGFVAALDEAGYLLANGDRRSLVVVDRKGGAHALSRTLGIKAAEIKHFMADVDRAALPDVEQARTQQQTRQEARREQQPLAPEQAAPAAPAREAAREPAAAREPERPAAHAAIAESWQAAQDPLEFVVRLGERGYSLATTEQGRYVAVDGAGDLHPVGREALGDAARAAQRALDDAFGERSAVHLPAAAEVQQRIRDGERVAEEAAAARIDRIRRQSPYAEVHATHAAVSADREADKAAARSAIGESWRAAEDPLHFAVLLGERGYTLAENDQGRYVAVDRYGASHAIGRDAVGEDARGVQKELTEAFGADSVVQVPGVAEVRQRLRAEEDRGPYPDRRGAYADIQPEAVARRQEWLSEKAQYRAVWLEQQRARSAGFETVQDINAAWQAVQDNPRTTFAAALDDRGIILARVADADAVQSRAEQIEAQLTTGKQHRALEVGELCGVDRFGKAWAIDARIVRADEQELQEFLAGLDTDQPTVAAAKKAHEAERQERRDRWQEERRQLQADRLGGYDDIKAMREAYREAVQGGAVEGAVREKVLTQALESRDLLLARVAPEEAATSNYNAEIAEQQGGYRPRIEMGDLLAVNRYGRAWKLDSVTLDDPEAGNWLCGVQQGDLLTLSQARDVAGYLREQGETVKGFSLALSEHDGGPGVGMVMGGVATALESVGLGIGEFLFGGGEAKPEPVPEPVAPVVPADAVARSFKREMDLTEPAAALQSADFEGKKETFTLGVRPEIVEAMRRRIEAKRLRELTDEDRDRGR